MKQICIAAVTQAAWETQAAPVRFIPRIFKSHICYGVTRSNWTSRVQFDLFESAFARSHSLLPLLVRSRAPPSLLLRPREMAYEFLPTLMGGMPSCLTPCRHLVISLCPLARRTPAPRIPHLSVSLTLSPSPSPHLLPISFTPSLSPLSVSFTLAPLPITLTLALSPLSLSSSHCHLSPSLSPSASLSRLVSNGLAQSHSPSPSPQERVSLPLNLPLASPAPSSYLWGGVFFSAPSHSADPSP